MPYATPGDVRAVLTPGGGDQASTDPATAAQATDDEVNAALGRAQARIDGRLAGVYAVPFNPAPPLIAGIAVDLAAYDLTLTFRKGKDFGSNLDPMYLRYKDAVALLDGLADGTVTLGPGTETVLDPVNTVDAVFNSDDWRTSWRPPHGARWVW